MRERTVSVRAVAIGWALVACGMAQAENLGSIDNLCRYLAAKTSDAGAA